MAEAPDPVARLDDYLATATLAHEAIWGLRRRAIARGLEDPVIEERLTEAAELVVAHMPQTFAEARRLRDVWSEQELLDPIGATETVQSLAEELDRVEPAMRRLRTRQNEIARELQRLLDEAP